jgi:hypothetical protein
MARLNWTGIQDFQLAVPQAVHLPDDCSRAGTKLGNGDATRLGTGIVFVGADEQGSVPLGRIHDVETIGFVKAHANLALYTILDAGHMIPSDQPEAGMQLLSQVRHLKARLRCFLFARALPAGEAWGPGVYVSDKENHYLGFVSCCVFCFHVSVVVASVGLLLEFGIYTWFLVSDSMHVTPHIRWAAACVNVFEVVYVRASSGVGGHM